MLDCSVGDCRCIDADGSHVDASQHVNGSWSANWPANDACPTLFFSDPPFPCFLTAGNFNASIGWLVRLNDLGDNKAQWAAALNLDIPLNPFAATIGWRSPIYSTPMDCAQTVSDWTVIQASLDAYNGKVPNVFGDLVYLFGANHFDLSNMRLTLHA